MPPDFCSRLFENVPKRIRAIIEWLMDKILRYDKACKSDYEKILV